MTGVISLYKESAKDLTPAYDKDGKLYIYDSETGTPRNDIAKEHGAVLKIKNGKVSVGEKNDASGNSEGNTVFNRSVSKYNADEVASIHTHPNEGKRAVATVGGGRTYFNDKGPSLNDRQFSQPKSGYFNIVVDKNNVYFYNSNKVISISRTKL